MTRNTTDTNVEDSIPNSAGPIDGNKKSRAIPQGSLSAQGQHRELDFGQDRHTSTAIQIPILHLRRHHRIHKV